MSDLTFLVEKAMNNEIFDIQVNFIEPRSLSICSYGHRLDIPDYFKPLGDALRRLIIRNLILRKLSGYQEPQVDRGFTKGEFANAISGGTFTPLQPLQMKFYSVPWQANFPVQYAKWRWQGAIRRALVGDDISYDCAALSEASRMFGPGSAYSPEQLGSSFYPEPFSKDEVNVVDVTQAMDTSKPHVIHEPVLKSKEVHHRLPVTVNPIKHVVSEKSFNGSSINPIK